MPWPDQKKHRKLSDDQVREIRNSGKTLKELAEEFGVAVNTVAMVRRKETYRDV